MHTTRLPLLPVLALLLGGSPLAAQTVRGVLVERDDARPIRGAFLRLVDDAGREHGGVLTDSAGRFLLRAPLPGRFRIQAELIGHETTLSPPLELTAGDVLTYRMEAATQPVALTGIAVSGERRCELRPEQGLETARVWEEARKALEIAAWSGRNEVLSYRLVNFERRLEPHRLRVVSETRNERGAFHRGSPFTSRPAEELATRGFIQDVGGDTYYYGPDADVLLSDVFLDGHCLRLTDEDPPARGWIGLAFEPVGGSGRPDIEGVLWLDRASAELRRLDFRYTRLPWPELAGDDRIGGTVEFERVPGGPWIIRRWGIRMPVVELRRRATGAGVGEPALAQLHETGGEVLEIRTALGGTIAEARRAGLEGTVHDSTRTAPLAGATVRLEGAPYTAVTDALGRFAMHGLPAGLYRVSFTHPRLDSLPALSLEPKEVELRLGEQATVALAIPPVAEVLAATCAAEELREEAPSLTGQEKLGTLVLLVRDPADEPVSGAEVRLDWSRADVEFRQRPTAAPSPEGAHYPRLGDETVVRTQPWMALGTTDERGRVVICDLPLGVPVRASARADAGAGEAELFLRETGLSARVLALGQPPAAAAAAPAEAVALDPIEVEARSQAGRLERSTGNANHFVLERAHIVEYQSRGARGLGEMLRMHRAPAIIMHTLTSQTDVTGALGNCVQPARHRPTVIGCDLVSLSLDGVFIEGPDVPHLLKTLSPDEVESMEYLPPTEATFRFGTAAGSGVLVVTTRRGTR